MAEEEHIYTYHVGAPEPVRFNDSRLLTAGNGSQIMMPPHSIGLGVVGYYKTSPNLPPFSIPVRFMRVICGETTLEARLSELGSQDKCNCVGALGHLLAGVEHGIYFIANVQAMQNGDVTKKMVYDIYAARDENDDGSLQLGVFRIYDPTLKDEIWTCASLENPAHIARLIYDPMTGYVTVNTGFARRLKDGEDCEGGGDTFEIDAPYRWCGGKRTGYTEKASPEVGELIFPMAKNTGQMEQGESIEQAMARIASDTVAAIETRSYLADADGQYYWRDEGLDSLVSYSPLAVRTQEHPRGLQPAADLWRETGDDSVVVGGTVGRLFSSACSTNTPTAAQAQTYSIAANLVGDGGIWQSKKLIIGNYSANGDYGEQPYMEDSGETVQTFYIDPDTHEKVWFTSYQMRQFPGATASASAYVPAVYHNDESDTSAVTVTISAPVPNPDTGDVENEDWISLRRMAFTVFRHDGLWYQNGVSGSSRTGYVFGEVITAEGWMLSPCIGDGTIYTRNTDGTSDTSVYYTAYDLTGGTTAVVSSGSGVFRIIGTSGNNYYSSAHGVNDPETLF